MIYLDNAATSFPKPECVSNEINRVIKVYGGNPGRGGHFLSLEAAEKVYTARESIAAFFGIENPENIIFTGNATEALNIAIKGLLKEGDEVICSDREHNAVMRPLYKLNQNGVVTYLAKVDSTNDEQTVKAFESLITDKTKMIICTAASNVTGIILPIEKIGELCKRRGIIFLVDASQMAGSMTINMDNIDLLACPGHKGLYGPQGTGILLINNSIDLDTIIEGGTGTNSRDLIQPLELPERLESGTVNTPGIAGLGAAVKFIKFLGIDDIGIHERRLRKRCLERLLNMTKVKVLEPVENAVGIVSFNIEGISDDTVTNILSEKGICLRSGLHCAPIAHDAIGSNGSVRASFGIYNTLRDIETFYDNIYKLVKNYTKK